MEKAKRLILAKLEDNLERIAAELSGKDLDRRIREWPWKYPDGTKLEESLKSHLATIDPAQTLAEWRTTLQRIVTNGDHREALRIYSNKGLPAEVGQIFGIRNYIDYVLRRLGSNDGAELRAILQKLVPVIPSH